jgi:hypothetical protein
MSVIDNPKPGPGGLETACSGAGIGYGGCVI